MTMKLADIPETLSRMRADPAAWADLACVPGPDDGDANGQARNACLLGLQYDRRAEDRALILFLLEQEIAAERAGCGGGDSRDLAIFLTAMLDEPSLAWLILAAKSASFDSFCAVDHEALFSAGVERTMAMLAGSDLPERDQFDPPPSQADVDAWWTWQRGRFPDRWEDQRGKASLCQAIGDMEAGAGYLRQELAESLRTVAPGSVEEKRLLEGACGTWIDLGQPEEAAIIRRTLDALIPEDAWQRTSELARALEIYVSARQFDEAACRVEPLRDALLRVPSWRTVGLGRMAAGTMADLAIATRDQAAAAHVFTILEELMAGGLVAPFVLLEKLATIAARLDWQSRVEHYRGLAQAEQARIMAEEARWKS